MAVYVDFTYYTGTYGGTAVASSEFRPAAIKASAFIDYVTMDRTAAYFDILVPTTEEAAVIDKVRMAVCAVMDEQQSYADAGGIIASESVGSHSVSYAGAEKRTRSTKLADAAKTFLAHTGLMFRGFNADEYGTDTVYTWDDLV